jgi:hypothetical protein
MRKTVNMGEMIYHLLIVLCDAPHQDIDTFSEAFARATQNGDLFEWRFQGDLGFGGKFWINHPTANRESGWYVNCYREDETPKRLEIITNTNNILERLWLENNGKES